MRIQRAIARAGVASRRAAEVLVSAGRVTVNGVVATIGQTVTVGADDIRVDGKKLRAPEKLRWLLLNKPVGVMSTKRDPEGRRTIFELLPEIAGLTYVGRLDYMTEGVLLLTNDGEGAHALTHPSREVPRTYIATVRGNAEGALSVLRRGVMLEDGLMKPDEANVRLGELQGTWDLEITLHEGRNREIRRVCEALELRVHRLVRTEFGSITLGTLRPGEWRDLKAQEVRQLLSGSHGR